MLCSMDRTLDKFGTELFRLNYLQIMHYMFGWHMSSVKTLIKKMLLGDRADWGLSLSIGLILLFRGVEPCELLMWTLAAFTLRTEGEWKGSGCCWEGEHGSGRQTFLRMHSKGTTNLLKWKVMEQQKRCSNWKKSSKGFLGTASALLALWSSLHKGCLFRLNEVHSKKVMFLSIPCYECALCVVAFFLVNNYLITMNWLFFN